MNDQRSTFFRISDPSLVLATSSNHEKSCFRREQAFDIFKMRDLLNLQYNDAVESNAYNCPMLSNNEVHYLIFLPKAFRYPLSALKTIAPLNRFPQKY